MISGLTRSRTGESLLSGSQRLVLLYVRGQGLLVTLLMVVAICLAAIPLRQWASFDDWGSWGTFEQLKQFAMVQVVPALAAAVIGVSAWSPLAETERTSVSALPKLRVIHFGGLLAVCILLVWLGFVMWESRSPGIALEWVAVRNTIGYVGLGLLATRLIDPRLSWLAPLTWCAVAVSGAMFTPIERLWMEPGWQWSGLRSDSAVGWAVALILGGAGLVAGVCFGARDGGVGPGDG